ncbi:MAG: HEAT repeat domain-containing protein [Armatimonadota bacterium]|jgi:hypothetical protein
MVGWRRRQLVLACLAGLLGALGWARAARVVAVARPNLDVPEMLAEAEIVAEVSGIAARSMGDEAGPLDVACRATVSCVLKGDAELEGQEVQWRSYDPRYHTPYPNPFAAPRGIVFLKSKTGARFELIHPAGGFLELPARRPAAPALPATPLEVIRAELLNCLRDQDVRLVSAAAARLGFFPEDTPTREALFELVHGLDALAAMTACRALMRLEAPEGVEAAAQLLQAPPLPDIVSRLARRRLVHAVSKLEDDGCLKHVLTLTKAPDADVRQAAAQALGNMPSPEAVKALGEALWDGDRMVRYWAIHGLARITRIRGYAPMWSLYEPDEDKYLTFWRKWYEEVGKPGVEEPEQ